MLFPAQLSLGGVELAFGRLALLAQDAPPEADPSAISGIPNNPLTPLVGIFLLFYFIFIAPERRRKSEEAAMLSAIKKNDRVVTVGGIHATVVAAPQDSAVVTLKIDENGNTRIKVNRSAISKVVREKENQDGKNKEAASETKEA